MPIHSKRLLRLNKENAQTMVEFAIVFPIVLLITYGLIELGRMVFLYAEITGAAREGARFGVASGYVPDIIPYTPYFAYCDGIMEAARRVTILIPANALTIKISYDTGPGYPEKYVCPPPKKDKDTYYLVQGNRIIVRVDYNYQPILGNFLGFEGFDIHATNYRTILMRVKIGD